MTTVCVAFAGGTLRRRDESGGVTPRIDALAGRPLKRRRVGILRQRGGEKHKGEADEEDKAPLSRAGPSTEAERDIATQERGAIAALQGSPARRKLDKMAADAAAASESPRLRRFAPALCALVSAVSEEQNLELGDDGGA